MILNKKTVEVDVDKLISHPKNPRRGNLDAIKESISVNGFWGAVIVQSSTNYILAGNHRFLAAQELGFKKVPAIFVDVDDEAGIRILLADNRTNDVASYDFDVLAGMLKDLDGKIEGTGYDTHDIDVLLKRLDADKDRGNVNGKETSKEIDTTSFVFEHACPKCGFEF